MKDARLFLWLLKLGSLVNLGCFVDALGLRVAPELLLPSLVLFTVNGYRCAFPVRYEHNIVFHDTPVTSVFATRLLATFAELGFVWVLAQTFLRVDGGATPWVTAAAWVMLIQCAISQAMATTAVITGDFRYFLWEEAGWLLILGANAFASLAVLSRGVDPGNLLVLNVGFALLFLPWQILNLVSIWKSTLEPAQILGFAPGLKRAIHHRAQRHDLPAWGGVLGLMWMAGYWALLVPLWTWWVLRTLAG